MALFEIQSNFDQVVAQLTRIADALDRAIPHIPPQVLANYKKRDGSAIIRYGDDNRTWATQTAANLIHERGLAPAAEEALIQKMVSANLQEDDEDLLAP